jgi:hypothetical protein
VNLKFLENKVKKYFQKIINQFNLQIISFQKEKNHPKSIKIINKYKKMIKISIILKKNLILVL